MKSSKYYKSAIGLEISLDNIILSYLVGNKDHVEIKHLKHVATAPKTIINGKIIDPDTLSNQIVRILSEFEYDCNNIVVGMNDRMYFKQVARVPKNQNYDIREWILKKIEHHHTFLQEEYQSGYHVIQSQDSDFSDCTDILFAAIAKSKVESITDLISHTGLNLCVVDLLPLSTVRTLQWNGNLSDGLYLSVFVDTDYTDLMILDKKEILFTQTIRKEYEEIIKDEFALAEFVQKIKNFVYSHQNFYPKHQQIQNILISTKLPSISEVMSLIQEAFTDFSIRTYQLSDNFELQKDMGLTKIGKTDDSNMYISSIGLALKYFEPYNQTLNLTKYKKQIETIVNRFELVSTVVVMVVIGLLSFGSQYMLNRKSEHIDSQIQLTKKYILDLQTGDYILQKEELKKIVTQIKMYKTLSGSEEKKLAILLSLLKELPMDITFSTLVISNEAMVQIKGKAFLTSSIYSFYAYIVDHYSEVQLKEVVTQFESNKKSSNEEFEFSLSFSWKNQKA